MFLLVEVTPMDYDDNYVTNLRACSIDTGLNHPDQLPDTLHAIHASSKHLLKLPLPPSSLKPSYSEDDIIELIYQDTNQAPQRQKRGGANSDQFYDDVGINESIIYAMNKNPPPIWRPGMDPSLTTPNNECKGLNEAEDVATPPHALSAPLPLPSPRPRRSKSPAVSHHLQEHGVQMPPIAEFNLTNDPKFKQKLQQKRQDLYDDREVVLRNRSISVGEISVKNVKSTDRASEGDLWASIELNSVLCESPEDPVPYLDYETTKFIASDIISKRDPLPPSKSDGTTWRHKLFHQQAMAPQEQEGRAHSGSPIQNDIAPPLPSLELLHRLPYAGSSQDVSTSRTSAPIFPLTQELQTSLASSRPSSLYSETPPPVPMRLSSNRTNFSANTLVMTPSAQNDPLKFNRGNPLARHHSESPTNSGMHERQKLPLPCSRNRNQIGFDSFTNILAHVISSPNLKRKNVSAVRRLESEDTSSQQPENLEQELDFYDDIQVRKQRDSWLESSVNASGDDFDPNHGNVRSLPIHIDNSSSSDLEEELYDDIVSTPEKQQSHQRRMPRSLPVSLTQGIQTRPRIETKPVNADMSNSSVSLPIPKSRSNCPPLQPTAVLKHHSDKQPSTTASNLPLSVQFKPRKPAVTDKPTMVEKPTVAVKPTVADKLIVGKRSNFSDNPKLKGKPTVARKPDVADISKQLLQQRMSVKPMQHAPSVKATSSPPPIQPRPSKHAAVPSPPVPLRRTNKHQQQTFILPPTKHKPKPSKKPFQDSFIS